MDKKMDVGDKVKIARAHKGYMRYLGKEGTITYIHNKFARVKLRNPDSTQPWRNEPVILISHLDKINYGDIEAIIKEATQIPALALKIAVMAREWKEENSE